MSKWVKGEDMKCPLCGENLSAVDKGRYETLAEHVGAPNREPSVKTGYGCTNGECDACQHGIRWLHDGEGPYRNMNGVIPRDKWYPEGTFWYQNRKR